MPEFIRPPSGNDGLLSMLAQMQARRNDPIAEGIMRAGQAIGQGLSQRGQLAAQREEQRNRIIQALAESGQLDLPTGTVVNGQPAMDPMSGTPLNQVFGEGFPANVGVKKKLTKTEENSLNDAEIKLLAKQLKMEPDELKGVRRDVVMALVPQTFIDPSTGKVITAPKGAKVLPGSVEKPMSAESAKVSNLAQSGVTAIDAILKNVNDKKNEGWFSAKNLAGGIGAGFFSALGGTEAQVLNDKIMEAQDALARLRTGATITADEEKRYNQLLRGRFKTKEAYVEALGTFRKFLEGVGNDITAGKRKMGPQSPASGSAPIALSGDKAKRLAELRAKAQGGK